MTPILLLEGSKARPDKPKLLLGTNDMARKKTSISLVNARAALSERLREVRLDLFGFHGSAMLASKLNIPTRTWYNYETGVTVPGEILLGFVDLTGVNPAWLLRGEGPKYLARYPNRAELSHRNPERLAGVRTADSAIPGLHTVDTSSLDFETINAFEQVYAV